MKAFFIFFAVAVLVSCKKDNTPTATTDNAVTYTTGLLQFTAAGTTYKFTDSIIAKQSIENGLKRIYIEVKKDNSDYQLNIVGTSTQISPGVYPIISTGSYTANSSLFIQHRYDYIIIDKDFSLQVLSYQNNYLNATFNSTHASNGIIKDLIIPQ